MKILVVQTAFFGDVILSTPVIKAIHEIYPEAQISILTTKAAAPLVRRDPLLTHVFAFDKRGRHSGLRGLLAFADELRSHGFDRVYSLHRSYRTSLLLALAKIPMRIAFRDVQLSFLYHQLKTRIRGVHAVRRHLAILEGEGAYDHDATALRLYSPEATEVSPQIATLVSGQAPRIVVFPGSEWETKMWHWSEYRKLAAHYLAKGYTVIVMGAPKEKAIADAVCKGLEGIVNLAGSTTLDEVLFLVKNATLIVCNDSMALHTAGGFQVPVVSVFCATTPAFGFGPWMTPSKVIEREGLLCKPCRRHGGRVCPIGTEECMRGVASARVIQAADELISG